MLCADMQPETGGRFELRLEGHDERAARYELTLATATGSWRAAACVAAGDGAVDVSGCRGAGEPPRWLLQYARAALRGAWHQHAKQGWPRRLTRWRDVPARAAGEGGDEG